MEKILAPLFKNTPLALVVIGLVLIIMGAVGKIERFSLAIDSPYWRIGLAVMGAIVASFGGLLIWRENSIALPSVLAKKFGLQITSPVNGDLVNGRVRLVGRYRSKPPDESVTIIEASAESGNHYFRSRPFFHENTPQWSAECDVGGGSGSERIYYVAVMGKSAEALRKYYFHVLDQTKQWPGIKELPVDFEAAS
jgi:hypothetical protein